MKQINTKIWVYLIGIGFLISPIIALSQLQTAHWYFGDYAGLDFSSGTPQIDLNGQISTLEGCTSISDENGNLLFYTDGRKVYDSSHNQMPNGSGLRGDKSSSQSAVVLPVPDDCNLYYIFTIDVRDQEVPSFRPKRGIEYNIVDMSLNGGLGDVIPNQKNISVPINGTQQGYEKLAAISNSDKTGYWIVTHFEGNFYAFSITGSGVDLNPVVSPTPGIFGGDQNIGYLNPSPDGSRLAMGMYYSFCSDRSLSVYDFNNETGIVTNENLLYDSSSGEMKNFYGVVFSPNSDVLYTLVTIPTCTQSSLGLLYNSSEHQLLQYDLTAASIAGSVQNLGTMNQYGALSLALDGNIYFNGSDDGKIGRIENSDMLFDPLTLEGPTVIPNAIDFGNVFTGLGFPQFLNHYFRVSISINGLANTGSYCGNEAMDFDFCSQGGEISTVEWDFGDGNISTEMNPKHSYNKAGNYTVTITLMVDGEEYVRTIGFEIILPVIGEVETATTCYGLPAGLTVNSNGDQVYWYNDVLSTTPIYTGSNFTTPNITEVTTWYFDVRLGNCYSERLPFTVEIPISPILTANDTLICLGDSATIHTQISGGKEPYSYLWITGDDSPSITVLPNHSFVYSVSVFDDCGTESAAHPKVSISPVKARFSFDIENVFDVDFTNHSFPFGQVESYWDFGDGRSSDVFEPFHRYTSTDDYPVMLTVTDRYGCVDTTQKLVPFPVQVYIPTAFSPNEDGINDIFKVVAEGAEEVELWIFDRWGAQVHHQKDREVWWNGSNNADGYYVPTGVYTYIVVVNLEDEADVLEYQGAVTVLR